MAYNYDQKNNQIVIDGFEKGISNSPYAGFNDMRNAEIIQEEGEISVAFTAGAVTLPPALNLVSFTGTASSNLITVSSTVGLYEGCAISINTFSGTGLNTGGSSTASVSYVVAGGGGAGGNARSNATNGTSAGGGGGGGEVKSGTTTLGIGTVAVTVGDGGTPAGTGGTSNGGNGNSSVLGTIATSLGGAGGGSAGGSANFSNAGTNSLGGNGGAGGGADTDESAGTKNGGTGTFAGGNASGSSGSGGGGGSSTAGVGSNASAGTAPGFGADGQVVSINGFSSTLGGGGGGGGANSGTSPITIAEGGDGGGGNGGRNNNGSNIVAPVAGTANFGGGGGGGASQSGAGQQGGAGGSGIVVITYLTGSMVATGGEITTSGPYTVHTFTENGEFDVIAVGEQSCYYVRNLTATTFQLSDYPNSSIVDITADGTGTFTTFQYGNQRGLSDNGAPVSYFNAPEIGGVLLIDSSNYAWLWQQGSDGASPINTLLFLKNATTTIGESLDNQVGIAYWNGYVVLVQQPSIVNVLNWSVFTSINGITWNSSDVVAEEEFTAFWTFASSVGQAYSMVAFEGLGTAMPQLLGSDHVFAAGSSTTVTSNSITLEAGETIVCMVATWNNQSVSSATFNGNAMTSINGGNDAVIFPEGYRIFAYTAPTTMTGTVVGTYAGAVTNRVVSSVYVKNMTTTVVDSDNVTGIEQSSGDSNVTLTKPNQAVILFMFSDDIAVNLTTMLPASFLKKGEFTNSTVGKDWLFFSAEGHGATQTLKKNVPVIVATNNTLYWGDGENIVASLNQNAGTTFDPTQPDTFVFSWEALDLPTGEIVQSLTDSPTGIMIGADSKKIYPWDTISPSFDAPVDFPEPAVVDFVATNNLIYAFAGNQGRIYLTNESSASLYREIPGAVTGAERPFFFFWDANVGNNELYFSFQSYLNSAPDTPLTTTSGVWAINSDTNALRMVLSTLNANAWVRMVNPVADGYTQEFLRPPGQGLLVGYSVGSNYYLDYSTSLPSTDYSTWFESEIIPVGTFFDKQTFQHIEYKLGTPMVAGEGIRVYQRSNLDASYTLIKEFTNTGLISDQTSINWENVEWVQFKVELKSTVTDPSYVRMRELRIR